MAEQHRLLEEVLFAAEVAHREELKIQRLELEQKIQGIHQQFFRGGNLAELLSRLSSITDVVNISLNRWLYSI
ncbi:TPA: hypothetical protein R4B11_004493 [Salmonella enterica subsp. enterica serovar Potsdam]|nr:hypothetical protein [Salmonella enterica]HEC8062267.1 hypothetical protein [Salmonella enterica subsp. enterica serovar Potsdam]